MRDEPPVRLTLAAGALTIVGLVLLCATLLGLARMLNGW